MRYILLETTLFDDQDDIERTRQDLCWFMEALTQRNQDYLKQRPDTPRLYKSGVIYEEPKQFGGDPEIAAVLRAALNPASAKQRDVRNAIDTVAEVFSGEHFCDIGTILRLGKIDCDGLACWRAAELRQAGIEARPYMTHRTRWGGGTVYHALVLWPPFASVSYATSEDPSLLLGMGGAARTVDRAEEIRKNSERCDLLRKSKARNPSDLVSLEDILGLKRSDASASAAIADIERLLRRAA